MVDKKQKRAVALPRLHKSVEDFAREHEIVPADTVADLLAAIQAAWFEEAKK